ncbi:MAG: bifunctional 3-deoxy-7-phosphoheptulonate synthase/chorismate mutase type II [Porphyromonadaceae bacterium]|nr:bifunctional 3-deoxy-7-phosphoheptulonate synthase/chorismate mutase type II [Porphyromonadaceae bacterium]
MSAKLIVAGPCSAETEYQVIDTAKQLASIGITHYRAGVWKPRTLPNTFEGVGQRALPWLLRVKRELGMQVGTEVANREHIALAIDAGVDFVWLGARTVTNPFAVQEIADRLKDMTMDITVYVKNPVIADIALWLGAIERLQNAGVTRLVAVHRGFHSVLPSVYRNSPQWYVPIELKRLRPDITLLCDPSHISGNSDLVEIVANQAAKLNYDGLMVEVHNSPKDALSDKNQQITPEQFAQILAKIRFGSTIDGNETLSVFRAQIDELDKSLFDIIAHRMELSEKIGQYKKANNISVLQFARYEELLSNSLTYAKQHHLNADFVKQIVELIHQESINRQL